MKVPTGSTHQGYAPCFALLSGSWKASSSSVPSCPVTPTPPSGFSTKTCLFSDDSELLREGGRTAFGGDGTAVVSVVEVERPRLKSGIPGQEVGRCSALTGGQCAVGATYCPYS